MKRIFLTLAVLSVLLMLVAMGLGLAIDDPRSLEPGAQWRVSVHMLTGLAALTFSTLLHAILFTYFMGTGRWLEETTAAYRLDPDWHQRNQRIKYRVLPGIMGCVLLMITTGALGAAADPASPVSADGFPGLSGSTLHFTASVITLLVNLIIHVSEYNAVARNMLIIEGVLGEVKRIRMEHGLPVE